MTAPDPSKDASNATHKTAPRPRRERGRIATFLLSAPAFHLVVIVLLAAIVVVVTVWRMVSVSGLEREIVAVQQRARAAMLAQSSDMLELSAVPLAWAIRAEVLTNDVGDIDSYMQRLVHEKYVKRIVYADAGGKIVSSTNIKLKDQLAATALPGVALEATSARVESAGADLRMIVPVMDFERQIGTLVLDYSSTQAIDARLSAPR